MVSRAKRKNSAGGTSRRDAAATRRALIAAGEKVFGELSFEAATYEAIAAEAGANKALIAYHFGSKEGLHDAVIEALVADVLADTAARMGEEGADPAENLRSYVRALSMALAARPAMPAILMREYLSGSLLDRESPLRNVLQFFRTTERLYEAGRRAGAFRTLDPHILHLSIVGPVVHFIIAAQVRRRAADLASGVSDPGMAAFSDGLASLLLDGLRRVD